MAINDTGSGAEEKAREALQTRAFSFVCEGLLWQKLTVHLTRLFCLLSFFPWKVPKSPNKEALSMPLELGPFGILEVSLLWSEECASLRFLFCRSSQSYIQT
jgi:hypothetical protein